MTEFHWFFIVVFDKCVFSYSLKISLLYLIIWSRMLFVILREFKKPWYSLLLCRVPYLILHSSLVFTRCQHCLLSLLLPSRCQKSFLLNKNIATAFADNFHYELVAHHMHVGFLWAFTGVCFCLFNSGVQTLHFCCLAFPQGGLRCNLCCL